MFKLIYGKVIHESHIAEDEIIVVDDDCIIYVGKNLEQFSCPSINLKKNYISPGFIDLHIHGGGGYSFMDGTEKSFQNVIRFHESHGVTKMMPTTLCAPENEIEDFFQTYDTVSRNTQFKDNLIGVHMEGPYISRNQCGAQNSIYCQNSDLIGAEKYLKKCKAIKRMTIAPELDTDYKLAKYLNDNNVIASAGHTECLFQGMKKALHNGYSLITHMYSAMKGVTYVDGLRQAGSIEAILLNQNIYVELIADGKHLPAELIEFVYKIKGVDHIILTTDAMRAAGTECRYSYLGSIREENRVLIDEGVAKIPEKACLAGSIASYDSMVRFVKRKTNIPLENIIKMSSGNPARVIGIDNLYGVLEVGKKADIIAFNEDINILFVMKNGQIVCNNL